MPPAILELGRSHDEWPLRLAIDLAARLLLVFGLFAILAMFTLRSEPIGKTEITCFCGSVAIAVICSERESFSGGPERRVSRRPI